MDATKVLVLNIHIQGSFKKCTLLFHQAEMVFVVVWFLDHFTLKSTPSSNSIWIITFANHFQVWVMKFKPSLMFPKLPILTSNNVVWVNFSSVLLDETEHIVKASTAGDVPVCYEVIILFIEPQNFLLMGLICKIKGFYLIVNVDKCCISFFDGWG